MKALFLQWLHDPTARKAFVQGMAVVGGLYILLFLWVFMRGDATIIHQNDRLPSQTTVIESINTFAAPQHLPLHTPPGAVKPQDHSPLPNPGPGLYRDLPGGHLPIFRAKDNMSVFKAYKRPFVPQGTKKPQIALAIMGLGLSNRATESAIESLPPEISLIMSPYAKELPAWIERARESGHEVWLSLPLETNNYPSDDPGPHTALIGVAEQFNLKKLEWVMGRAEGYVGFVTPPLPRLVNAPVDLRPLLSDVYKRGLGFVDTAEPPSIVAESMAHGMHAPYASVDVWVDDIPTPEDISLAFAKLKMLARENGKATGIIRPLPLSYQETLRWVGALQKEGFVLAPLSAQTGHIE